ncbi:methylmalonyl Co-A mutase-associated GTPase MeaB [bacterium]|nr:methylmalonyl Co-A mutase-associated GTPase MeaB [bacterium]MBU1636632.1 methylmalonyl Co-A mutase-associated GTPase MeaB [bacterium]MBU1919767.1 methylmalonyl Co-A mutase-associated GTPase MeaB [bacterium]RQW00546.1 MAG: methylmalonyl Co-A mutase-associated GTPase MeaB [bacterium]
MSFIDDLLTGSRIALARGLTKVETGGDEAEFALTALADRLGGALRIGFTGPPGAGKSSLVTAFVKFLRLLDKRVAVIAVDPSSPFSGGALLGDRIRMNAIGTDEGVFVRSLATRGDLGGLSRAAGDMADLFDACGFDYVLFETVGVGQSELEIVQYADTVNVILVPESGDAIQGMKAGLMEVGDVFVVNKADRQGADRFVADLEGAMHLKHWKGWQPPVIQTIATKEEGIEDLHKQIHRHIEFLKKSGTFEERRKERIRKRIRRIVDRRVLESFWTEERSKLMEEALHSTESPYSITHKLLGNS